MWPKIRTKLHHLHGTFFNIYNLQFSEKLYMLENMTKSMHQIASFVLHLCKNFQIWLSHHFCPPFQNTCTTPDVDPPLTTIVTGVLYIMLASYFFVVAVAVSHDKFLCNSASVVNTWPWHESRVVMSRSNYVNWAATCWLIDMLVARQLQTVGFNFFCDAPRHDGRKTLINRYACRTTVANSWIQLFLRCPATRRQKNFATVWNKARQAAVLRHATARQESMKAA